MVRLSGEEGFVRTAEVNLADLRVTGAARGPQVLCCAAIPNQDGIMFPGLSARARRDGHASQGRSRTGGSHHSRRSKCSCACGKRREFRRITPGENRMLLRRPDCSDGGPEGE